MILSIVLVAIYARGLRSSLRSQSEAFSGAHVEDARGPVAARRACWRSPPSWSPSRATRSSARSSTPPQLGLSQFFIGAIVVAIVGNAAEHYVAVVAAAKDQMDLTISIAIGSAAQVGLLLAPLIALASTVIGPTRMPL